MTVTVMRPNKPASYKMGSDGRTHLIEESEEPAAAEPSTDALAVLKGLVEMLGDQKATQKRVAEFAEAVNKAREAEAARKAAEAERGRINAEIAAAEKASQDKLAAELAAHTAETQMRSANVDLRERSADKREAELDKREAKLQADRARLDRKLAVLAAAD
jgi:hypothetical protein